MNENDERAILLLAAGSSSRMGQSKQLLLINEKSLLTHTVEKVIESNTGNLYVVLGSQHEAHRELLKDKPVDIIFNPQWQAGIGSSIKTGLRHVLSVNPKTDAIIIMVCDQPMLQPHHLKSLIEKYQKTQASIVASAYSGTMGVPALFNRKHFDAILNLRDDEGAKKIIQHPCETVDFPEGYFDMDTAEDYKNFLHQHSKKMP